MIEGYNILAFTYADWHASWSTPQQIMARLAPANKVLFVDSPRSFLYFVKPRDPQGAGVWEGPSLREVGKNMWVYHPPHMFAPVGRLPFMAARQSLRVNGRILGAMIRKQMRDLGMRRRPILWNFSPLHGKAVQYLQRRLTIYDVCDEWANYVKHVSGKLTLGWMERELCRGADLVFTGTESARLKRLEFNTETHVVHHAADFDHFSKAALAATAVPPEIVQLPKPVIGCVGVMDPQRFDVALIERLSEARPHWTFVLVGPARAGMSLARLEKRANVYLTGNKPIEELPNYLKGMDVLLIPYQVNEATRDIYPLKLQEYLATGKPIVSSSLPAVLPYRPHVRVADSHEAFLPAIEEALASPGDAAARQAVARANSWDQRIAEKSAHIERLLAMRKESIGAMR
jgi:glycosyltransferase involved in cell wall biosynthesis